MSTVVEVTIFTQGKPGSGKTRTIQSIVDILEKNFVNVTTSITEGRESETAIIKAVGPSL